MSTFFFFTFVAPSAGSAPMTLGGVSSNHPPSGFPMRAQPCKSRSMRKPATDNAPMSIAVLPLSMFRLLTIIKRLSKSISVYNSLFQSTIVYHCPL